MKRAFVILAAVSLVLIMTAGILEPAFANGSKIPNWVRNVVTWWGQGQVSDDEFLKGIKFLVQNNIIQLDTKTDIKPSVFTDKDVYNSGDTITISGTGFSNSDVVVVVGNYAYLQEIDNQTKSLDLSKTDLSELGVLTQYQYTEDNVGKWVKRPYETGFAVSTKVHTDKEGAWQVTLRNYVSTDKNGNETTNASTLPSDAYIIKAAQKDYSNDSETGYGYKELSIKTAYTNISVQ